MLRSSRALVCAAALVCLTLLSSGSGPVIAAGSDILTFLFRVGTPFVYGSAPAQFAYPMGVAIDSTGRILVTDTESYGGPGGGVDVANNRIQIFTADGTLERILTTAGGGAGDFYYPTGVAVDADDQIVIADGGNNRILIFSPASTVGGPTLLREFGSFGDYDPFYGGASGPAPVDQLNYPTGVAVKPGTRLLDPLDTDGRIAILDNSNHRFVLLDSTLNVATAISVGFDDDDFDENAPGAFFYPWGIAFDATGQIYVSDTENHRVQVFTSAGVPLWRFGSQGVTNEPGELQRPTGIMIDRFGRLLVSDTDRSRVLRVDMSVDVGPESSLPSCASTAIAVASTRCQVSTSDGRFLEALVVGRYGGGAGQFIYPHAVAETPSNQIVVVDTDNHVFQVFERSDLALQSAAVNAPTGASVGVPVSLQVQVQNTGAGTLATSIEVVSQTIPGTLTAAPAVALAANATHTFTLSLVPEDDGTLVFQVRAVGAHATGEIVTTTVRSTDPIAIARAPEARLSARVSSAPPVVGVGGMVTVDLELRNSGSATFDTLAPVVTTNGPVTPSASTLDLSPLAPGATRVLTYQYSADAVGLATFAVAVTAAYADSSLPGGSGTLTTAAGPASVQISSDVTPPTSTITLASDTDPSSTGWYSSPVTVTLTASDGDGMGVKLLHYSVVGLASFSGAADTPSTSFVIPYLGVTTVTYWSEDRGGQVEAARSLRIRIDSEQPVIGQVNVLPAPNAYGWHNSDVEVRFLAGDGVSGVASVTPPTIVATEGEAQVVRGTVVDLAGNEAYRDGIVSIDKTAPVLDCAPDRAPGPSGWYAGSVTVTCTAVDQPGLSGLVLDSVTPPQTFSGDGVYTFLGEARDFAGNVGTQYLTIRIDRTAPGMTCSTLSGGSIWPPNHKMIPWTVGVTLVDPTSGVAGFRLVGYWSNEADKGLGDGNVTSDMQGWTLGTPDVSGFVRSERSGLAQGRIYTLKYEGFDIAGNVASCQTATMSVPHDQGKAAPAPAAPAAKGKKK